MESKMKEIKAIIQPFMLDQVLNALREHGELPGVMVSDIRGWGKSRAENAPERAREGSFLFAKKIRIEIVVAAGLVEPIIDIISRAARTGRAGDGKIFVSGVDETVKIRTGEHGIAAV